MKTSYLLTKELAGRLPLIHPPEPRKDLLLSAPSEGVYIGKTRFLKSPVFWDPSKLVNPHLAIIGITGSGKSYMVKTFLTRASIIWNTNAIIIDWVGEYNSWVKSAGGKVINLAKEKLNILDLAGLPKSSRTKQIMSALEILLELKNYPDEKDQIEETIESIYEKNSKANLSDVVSLLEKNNYKRAARLLKRFSVDGSDFFSGKTTLDIRQLTSSGLVCMDLHELPSEEIRSLAGLTILQYIKEFMRAEGMAEENKKVKLFVVLDEAWKIAQDEKSDVITIVREGRKYNFSLIVATQNPTDMHKTIFSNSGTVFVLRLVLKEFRDYVKNSIGYSEFLDNEISRFGVGDAAVNMIFAQRQAKSTTFLMNKIDGEDPLLTFSIIGDDLNLEIERDNFIRMLSDFGLDEKQISIIKGEFEKSDGALEGEKIVSLFEKFGYSKSSILSFMRQLGIEEKNLIKIFSLLKMRKAQSTVNLLLDDSDG